MTQSRELSAEAVVVPKPRRGARRVAKAAETRGRIVRRGMEEAADPVVTHERLMTAGLRASIIAAIAGITLFFHAPLGAAMATLFN